MCEKLTVKKFVNYGRKGVAKEDEICYYIIRNRITAIIIGGLESWGKLNGLNMKKKSLEY